MDSRLRGLAEAPLGADAVGECPVSRFMRLMGGKWKPLVLFHVANGTNRFGALQRAIPSVSKQMLTTQLREMEADGILHREVFPVVPPRVEYSLTALGASLMPVIDAIRTWGEASSAPTG